MEFAEDTFARVGVQLVSLEVADFGDLIRISQQFKLDFDDAYQYAAAQKYDLMLVSFDGDFDRTERGRKTPAEILGG